MTNSGFEDAAFEGNAETLMQIALHDPDILRSQWALEELEQHDCGQKEANLLLNSMSDPIPETRRRAIHIYDQLSFVEADAIPQLINSLKDKLWTIREASAIALAPYVCNDEVHAALVQRTLFDKSGIVRDAALQSLSQNQEQQKKTLDELLAGLKHKKPPVRWRAAAGLSCFHDSAGFVLSDLIDALNDSHRRVRLAATISIGKFGTQSVQALPTILRRRFENDFAIKQAAVETIRAILPGVPSSLQRSINPAIEWYQDAQHILKDTLNYYLLPTEVEAEFINYCHLRITALMKQCQGGIVQIKKGSSSWEASCAVLEATIVAGRACDEKKETAKLLAILIEIWLRHED